MTFLIKYWRYLAIILVILSLIGAVLYYGHRKYQDGWDKCTVAQDKAILEGIETHGKIKYEVKKLSDPDLDARLSRWLR